MTTHPYSTAKSNAPWFVIGLFLLSIVITSALQDSIKSFFDQILGTDTFQFLQIFADVSPLIFIFLLLYLFFDRLAWKWFTRTPKVYGKWTGELTSQKMPNKPLKIEFRIRQTWLGMSIQLESDHTFSYSLTGFITPEGDKIKVISSYYAEPTTSRKVIEKHYGTNIIYFSYDETGNKTGISGEYFTQEDIGGHGHFKVDV